jgi:hypothetical protein
VLLVAQEFEKGKAAVNFVAPDLVIDDARDWVDWREDSADYSRFEEQYEDDEEVEAFYFSSAAGRARIVGNRRFGENGFIASGRMQARPVPPTRPSKVCLQMPTPPTIPARLALEICGDPRSKQSICKASYRISQHALSILNAL